MRKYYIDNLRWSVIILLIPYHAAMAWNTWNEPNYIVFKENRIISSIVVSLSPFLMPILFVLAGISTKYAFDKRTTKQYLHERIRKLLIPFFFGILVLMPPMTYIADRYNCRYTGTFLRHYSVFFTKITDLTGADGGFSVGQFWFLIYLFIIAVIFTVILKLQQKYIDIQKTSDIPIAFIYFSGLPLLLLHDLLSVGGKSLVEYLYLFMIGYYVLSKDEVVKKLSEHRWAVFTAGAFSTAVNTYLFLWTGMEGTAITVINNLTRFLAEWLMILAVIGLSYRYFEKERKLTKYMSRRSFMFYVFHYIWVVLFQLFMHSVFSDNTFLLFIAPVVLAYVSTFLCCELFIRIPVFCFLLGTKPIKKIP